jgi:CarD family transcriptional regulator
MFSLNEKVVYPGHGVAQINRIVEKNIGGSIQMFFELKFLSKGVTILVPTNNLASVGLRRLSSSESINKIFKMLSDPVPRVNSESTASNWNKRNKEYQCRLRSGDLNEICKIYRDLRYISSQKELSFGEKNLLLQTEALLVEEISIVKQVEENKTIEQLRALLKGEHGAVMVVMGN